LPATSDRFGWTADIRQIPGGVRGQHRPFYPFGQRQIVPGYEKRRSTPVAEGTGTLTRADCGTRFAVAKDTQERDLGLKNHRELGGMLVESASSTTDSRF
jgi:hypothetical protein